jgi:phenylacetate-CoA ligase
VLRYRTGDITSLDPEPCRCGRTLIRMAKVTGRTDDMLIVRGINVFPSQIESILLRFEGIEPYYQIVVDRERSLDDLEIRVEVSKAIFAELSDEMRRLESFERKIRSEVESMLGISARVRLLEPGSLERSESKARRVVDRREL